MQEEHGRNVGVLTDFLLLPAEPGVTEPPPILPSLDGLPAALKTGQEYLYTADSEWKEKARTCLKACVEVDRSALAVLRLRTSGPYDAAHEQQEFVRKIVFPRRWKLEELASQLLALLEFVSEIVQVRSNTRTPSVSTSSSTDTGLNKEELDCRGSGSLQVHARDKNCRLTGVASSEDPEELDRLEQAGKVICQKLQVVHGLPFQMGDTSFVLVEALTGINCNDWSADCAENAFLAQPPVHELFGSFRTYFEWTPSNEIIIRGRTGAGKPDRYLHSFNNDNYCMCSQPGQFIDTPLRPRFDTEIADIDQKYFILHKFVGDIVWMSGGPEPDSDDEEEDEEKVVSDANIGLLLEKLESPIMDFVPQEQGMMFGSGMVLVHKNTVWV
ncbi:hypothetical protein B0H12DRAFT_1072604 [Mycena haematopus]|nr:hypothetical protein B0H12DRAFT_1072604 [Mycena haematopus]